jgi:PPOX class probable F420-dependent enzyme
MTEFPGKYLGLTSFKRDGTGVTTPVWFVAEGDRLLVKTDPHSGKVKRIRRNPVVTVAPCTAGGRLRGEPVQARAEVLAPSELRHVDALMDRKYRVDKVLVLPIYWAIQRLQGKRRAAAEVPLSITPV